MVELAEIDCFPKLLLRNYQEYPDKVAVRRKDFGIWNNYTWKDCYERVKYFSLGLISLGLQPGDKAATIGDEEPEGFWAIMAIQSAKAIPVPLYSDSHFEELKYLVGHSESKFVVAEDQEQVDKMLLIKDELPTLEKVIWWDPKGMRSYREPFLISFKEVMELGRKYEETHPGEFEKNVSQITKEDIAQLTYTSGTTGLPKGSIISHRVMMHCARTWLEHFNIEEGDDILNLIPAGSIFEQWFAGIHYLGRAKLHFAEEPETVMEDYREISPKIMLLGPRHWLTLSSTIQVKVGDAGWLKKLIYNLFMPVGHKVADLTFGGKRSNILWRTLHFLGEWLVYRPLRDKIGLVKTKYPLTGSTFLSPDVLRFFAAIGLPLMQVYGSTESGIVTCHRHGEYDINTIGMPSLNTNVRISDEGEILVSGDSVFSGYYKNPEATAEKIKDGWFHTGDAAFFTPEGHVVYVERAEDLRQLKGGYRYAPGYIEGRLKFSPYIQEAIVLGDEQKDYCSVIAIIDFEAVGKWAEDHRVGYTTFVDLSQKDEVGALIKRDMDRLNRLLPEPSRIKKYLCLHKEFDPDDAELTRLRKLRRKYIEERYHEIIDGIYQDKEEVPVEAAVKYRDGRTGTISTTLKIRVV